MNIFDYIVLGGLIIAITCTAVWIYRRKKRSAGCGRCPYNGSCAGKTR